MKNIEKKPCIDFLLLLLFCTFRTWERTKWERQAKERKHSAQSIQSNSNIPPLKNLTQTDNYLSWRWKSIDRNFHGNWTVRTLLVHTNYAFWLTCCVVYDVSFDLMGKIAMGWFYIFIGCLCVGVLFSISSFRWHHWEEIRSEVFLIEEKLLVGIISC